eukprot:scaffold10972_cov127-Isochrysis_galbana.AAC.9
MTSTAEETQERFRFGVSGIVRARPEPPRPACSGSTAFDECEFAVKTSCAGAGASARALRPTPLGD